jgi:hypothetical protein
LPIRYDEVPRRVPRKYMKPIGTHGGAYREVISLGTEAQAAADPVVESTKPGPH